MSNLTMPPVGRSSTPLPALPATENVPARPGKSGEAVGQVAKKLVADARAAGADVPKNAQGFAASQIARGADPASIFIAQTADAGETPVSDGAVLFPLHGVEADPQALPDTPAEAPAPDDAIVSEVDQPATATDAYKNAADVLKDAESVSARTALDLLT